MLESIADAIYLFAETGEHYTWIISEWLIWISLLILLPLSIFKQLRVYTGTLIIVISVFLGLHLWLWSVMASFWYHHWAVATLSIPTLILPFILTISGSLVFGELIVTGQLILGIFAVCVFSFIGVFLIGHGEQK